MALPKNPKFDLKLHYKRILETGTVIALLMIIGAFKFFPNNIEGRIFTPEPQKDYITSTEAVLTKQDRPVVPPKPVVPILAVNTDGIDDPILPPIDIPPDNDGKPVPPPYHKNIENEPAFEFIPVAEEMPEPVGGIAEIQKKVMYPPIAIKAGIQGRVTVQAYVDENGNVVKTELLKGIGGGCDEAARLAVEQTKFNPGKQRGKPVKVKVSVPVLFRLQ